MTTIGQIRAHQARLQAVLRSRRNSFVQECALQLVRQFRINCYKQVPHRNRYNVQQIWFRVVDDDARSLIRDAEDGVVPAWLPARVLLASAGVAGGNTPAGGPAETARYLELARELRRHSRRVDDFRNRAEDQFAQTRFRLEAEFADLMILLAAEATVVFGGDDVIS